MRSSRMTFIALYICATLAVMIEAVAIPRFEYREIQENEEELHKKSPIPILKHSFEQSKEGYQYSYETGNGIHAEESGYIKNKGDEKNEIFVQQGSVTYHDENGNPITLTYIADEKGFRPQGKHLPIPPPIPKEIVKAIEENAKHEEQEHQEETVYQEQEGEKESDNSEQLKLAQREYQRQIQRQIQTQIQQHQYQKQLVYQPKQIYPTQAEYQPEQQYQLQNQYQSRKYQHQDY